MKRWIAAALCALLLTASASAEPVGLSAQCAILMDADSGRVLFEQNAHEERDIASITKLMTALVAVEHADTLEEEVVIRPEWTGAEGSSIYLRSGERVTLKTLLYGLLLSSGNDAALAVAGYCAGDVEAFVDWMNHRAAQLGMEHTHFTNPSGLSEDGHYSTAYDMALLARACLANEVVAQIAATRSITLDGRSFTNHNKLLWLYEGCTGMKTGYTQAAGRTLVSSAQREGQTLIAVTLNAPNDWADHAALFDYGFAAYPVRVLCGAGEAVGRVPVAGSFARFVTVVTEDGLSYPLREDEDVTAQISLPDSLAAPVRAGDELGSLSFFCGGELIGQMRLTAAANVNRNAAEKKHILQSIDQWLAGN